ncbi:hypothetical protein [Radicibacter daui]|uniref:hypothetical protein n=1 Tax=Radicibacter daui TaxID=3064829 RepID=UPI0040470280
MTENANASAAAKLNPGEKVEKPAAYALWCLAVGIAFGFLGAAYLSHELIVPTRELLEAVRELLAGDKGPDFGSWADWSAAVGTIGAILFGVLQSRRQIKETRDLHQSEMQHQRDLRLWELQKASTATLGPLLSFNAALGNAMHAAVNYDGNPQFNMKFLEEILQETENSKLDIAHVAAMPPEFKTRFISISDDFEELKHEIWAIQSIDYNEAYVRGCENSLTRLFVRTEDLYEDLQRFIERDEIPQPATAH